MRLKSIESSHSPLAIYIPAEKEKEEGEGGVPAHSPHSVLYSSPLKISSSPALIRRRRTAPDPKFDRR